MKVSGNTVLITGGATGIGLALADALLAQGNDVIVCGRRRTRLIAARKKHPALHTRVADVSRPSGRRALVEWTVRRFPRLNMLVNNAGVQHAVDFRRGPRDLPLADEELSTNLAAPIHLSALLLPHLRRRREAAIVNISSGLGFTPLATELAGTRQRPEEAEFTMSAEAVAKGIVDALRRDRYEVALGAAANLHRQRDRMFEAIND